MKIKLNKSVWARAAIITVAVLAACVLAVWIYAADYYRAEPAAAEIMAFGETVGQYTVFDSDSNRGLVFYPGGKVEAAAYAPLMQALSERGITCVLVRMPLNLAVLDPGAWEGAVKLCPEVEEWYIGGHSLGGAMASGADTEVFSGLVLLAAYPTDEVDIPSLTVYGDLDGVMNREKYDAGLGLLSDNEEYVIKGGNHAGFGAYGAQSGDGEAAITSEEQIVMTADAIEKFIFEHID